MELQLYEKYHLGTDGYYFVISPSPVYNNVLKVQLYYKGERKTTEFLNDRNFRQLNNHFEAKITLGKL